jgi:ribose transport system substrate-binding protein
MTRPVRTGVMARPTVFAGLLCALLMVILSACSSSGSSSPGSASASPASSGVASPQVKAAQAVAAKWEKAPTALGVTAPLKTAPPAGKTFVWLNCELSACTQILAGIKPAVAAAGWKLKVVQYQQANPATVITALKLALSYHPSAVALSGLPEAVWSTEIPAYRAAGVPIIDGYAGPLTLNSTVIGNVSGPPDGVETGQILANWFIADSGGHGRALNVRTDELPYLKTFSDAFQSDVQKNCPGCTVTNLNMSVADATSGKVNSAVVADLQRNPSINYVIATEGPFIDGLPAALAAAGLSGKVKIAGENGDVQNLSDVKNGTEAAFTGASLHIGGWQYLDIAIRHAEGMTFNPYDGIQPKQLLTKSVTFSPSADYDQPANFPQLFQAMWKVH